MIYYQLWPEYLGPMLNCMICILEIYICLYLCRSKSDSEEAYAAIVSGIIASAMNLGQVWILQQCMHTEPMKKRTSKIITSCSYNYPFLEYKCSSIGVANYWLIIFFPSFSQFMFPLLGGLLTSFYTLPLSCIIVGEFLLAEVCTYIIIAMRA